MLSDLFAKWSEQTPAPSKSGVTKVTEVTGGGKPQKPAAHSVPKTVTQTETERVTRVTASAPPVTQVTLANPGRVTGPRPQNSKEPAASSVGLPRLPKLPPKIEHPNSAASAQGAQAKNEKACGGSAKWDTETAALIQWFLGTEPPTGPFRLQRAVYVAHPAHYWEYLKGDVKAGPGRARGKTGAFQENLRQLYRVFHEGNDIGGGTT